MTREEGKYAIDDALIEFSQMMRELYGKDEVNAEMDFAEFMDKYYEMSGNGSWKPRFFDYKYVKGHGPVIAGADHGMVAHHMIDNPWTRCCKIDGALSIKRGAHYIVSSEDIEREVIKLCEDGCDVTYVDDKTDEFVTKHLSYTRSSEKWRAEVMKYMYAIAPEQESAPKCYIVFKNGVVDVVKFAAGDDDYFTDHIEPDMYIIAVVPHDFVPDAPPVKVVDEMFYNVSCGRPNVSLALQEVIGHCMYRDMGALTSAPVLVGPAGGGKSTILDFVRFIVGEENTSNVKLQNFSSGQYTSVHTIAGKLVNIDDDVSSEYVKGNTWSVVKQMTAGKSIHADVKWDKNGVDFVNTATLLMASNHMFKVSTRDSDQSMQDRLVFIPCDARIRDTDKQDLHFEEKLLTEEAAQYGIWLGLQGLARLLQNKRQFSVQAESKGLQEQFVRDNNTIEAWLYDTEMGVERFTSFDFNKHKLTTDAADGHASWDTWKNPYLDYIEWCAVNGRQGGAVSESAFSQYVCPKFHLRRTKVQKVSSASRMYLENHTFYKIPTTWRGYELDPDDPENVGKVASKGGDDDGLYDDEEILG